jgi:coproporphyrinogen III oxidase-like Fe-S oxidoreductase
LRLQLTLEPGTVFYSRPPSLPDDDAAWDIQTHCQRLLAASGYDQYEVSAYAKTGARCRHNLNYWRFGDYLGLGAGAHGKLTVELPGAILRSTKRKQPREFQSAAGNPAACERRTIPVADLPFEFMLNALRLNDGFENELFESRTGLTMAGIEAAMTDARNRNLIEATPNGWKPTDLGRRFLNDLQAGFLT